MQDRIRDALADRYFIERELGQGGSAVVFAARELKHNRRVALKVLKPEIASSLGHDRFLREVSTTAQLNHPNILPLFDSGEAGGFVFYTMPYVEGESLRERLAVSRRLPLQLMLSIARQLADALTYAHAAGVVHRDIKPDNIFLAADGHVWLADFGLARALTVANEQRLTRTGFAVGSPFYISPEQATGQRDVELRTDIYSLACVLFELLAGEPPFSGETVDAVLRRHLLDAPPSICDKVPNVPIGIDVALRRAMAKDPAERFATVRDFERALIDSSNTGSQPPEPAASFWDRLKGYFATDQKVKSDTAVPKPDAGFAAASQTTHSTTHVYRIDEELNPLVGRESDLRTALELVTDPACRVLTLTGPGGIGKTRLAREIAMRASQDFVHGACFVPLANIENADLMPAAIADALQLSLASTENPTTQLASFLQEKNLILVLDNFEQIVDGARLLVGLVTRAPKVRAVVTSRRRLRVAGEHVLRLDALTVPVAGAALEASAAGSLFLQVAKRSDPRFSPDAETVQAIQRICHITAGIPLAIELAAASVGVLSASEIARTLEHTHDVITGARRDLPARHHSLHAAFESSWQLLDSEERKAFRRLSVFRGSFDAGSAEVVTGAEIELLARLVEVSLIRRPGHGEFALLEVLRQFAEDKLVANPAEAADVRRRHSRHFLGRLAELAALPEGPKRSPDLDLLAHRFADVRAAWLHATSESAHDELRRAADGFFSLLNSRGRSVEGSMLFGAAVAAMRPVVAMKGPDAASATATLARLLSRQASFITDLGKISEASELVAEALKLVRNEGDEAEIAFAISKHGEVARANADFNSPVFQEALDRYRALNNLPGVARALNGLATAQFGLGHYPEAKALYQESIQLFRHVGLEGEAWLPLNNLSGVFQAEGDPITARKIMEDELQHARRRNQPRALSFLLTNLAVVCESAGDLNAAETYLAEGILLSREMGYRTRMAYALNTLAKIQFARGEVSDAGAAYREALEVAVQAEEGPLITSILVGIGRLLMKRNQTADAAPILKAVAEHPSCDEETKTSARTLLATLDTSAIETIPLDEVIRSALQLNERRDVA